MHGLVVALLVGAGLFPVAAKADPPVAETASDRPATLRGKVDLEESRKRNSLEQPIPFATVEARQELDGWLGNPARAEQHLPTARTTRTDAEGNFEIGGLPPGRYTVTVGAGLKDLTIRDVVLLPGAVLTLPDRQVIEPPLTLTARVEPATDPWQRSWKLSLLASDPHRWERAVLAESQTSEGLGRLPDLEPGRALLEVVDGSGQVWAKREVEVFRDQPEVFVAIDVVEVRGRLSLGDEKLGATLSFGTSQGQLDIRMTSGDDGKFQGYLPREGRWPLEILWPDSAHPDFPDAQRLADVEVRRRPGKTWAALDIRVPDTLLRGKVVHGEEAVVGAGITLLRERRERADPGSSRQATALTDAKGEFRLRGFEPGPISLLAMRGELTSDWTTAELRDGKDASAEVVLELKERRVLTGIVVAGTQPIAGARIVGLPAASGALAAASYVDAISDSRGTFELRLPADRIAIDLLVSAPGLGMDLLRLNRGAEAWSPAILQLDVEKGTLRVPLPDAPGKEQGSLEGWILRRGAAELRGSKVLQVAMSANLLEVAEEEIALHGLAPGPWTICHERTTPLRCFHGELPARGEVALTSSSREVR